MANIKLWANRVLIMLWATAVGTVFDGILHYSREGWMVEENYYGHKVYYGLMWMVISYVVLKKTGWVKKATTMALWSALITGFALQGKYWLDDYDKTFLFIFGIVHFVGFALGTIPAYIRRKDIMDLV